MRFLGYEEVRHIGRGVFLRLPKVFETKRLKSPRFYTITQRHIDNLVVRILDRAPRTGTAYHARYRFVDKLLNQAR